MTHTLLTIIALALFFGLQVAVTERRLRARQQRELIRRLRQTRRDNARAIRTLNSYLGAYAAEVERLKLEAQPRSRYVDDKGELVH
jgi:hypothetical protein